MNVADPTGDTVGGGSVWIDGCTGDEGDGDDGNGDEGDGDDGNGPCTGTISLNPRLARCLAIHPSAI